MTNPGREVAKRVTFREIISHPDAGKTNHYPTERLPADGKAIEVAGTVKSRNPTPTPRPDLGNGNGKAVAVSSITTVGDAVPLNREQHDQPARHPPPTKILRRTPTAP